MPTEETGSGHYTLGATATDLDALPGKPGWVIANGFTNYDGQAGAGQPLRFGGRRILGARATPYADTLLGLYETPPRQYRQKLLDLRAGLLDHLAKHQDRHRAEPVSRL